MLGCGPLGKYPAAFRADSPAQAGDGVAALGASLGGHSPARIPGADPARDTLDPAKREDEEDQECDGDGVDEEAFGAHPGLVDDLAAGEAGEDPAGDPREVGGGALEELAP